MFNYETRFDAVVIAVFEAWTNNGLGMDFDEREQSIKSVRDAVTNTYADDCSDAEWSRWALQRLRGETIN